VFDAFGKKVASLLNKEQYKAGQFDYIFNAAAAHLPAGVYYYTLTADDKQETKKMIVY
jgi:hypothetical protein